MFEGVIFRYFDDQPAVRSRVERPAGPEQDAVRLRIAGSHAFRVEIPPLVGRRNLRARDLRARPHGRRTQAPRLLQ